MAAKKSAKKPAEVVSEEIEKAHGKTDSQQENKAYHEGKFQTHDPITGEKRDKPLPE